MNEDVGDLDDGSRVGIGRWGLCHDKIPAVAAFMKDSLPPEQYDPNFLGQRLETTYFDTQDFRLRKLRLAGGNYLTLRIRCYQQPGSDEEVYAVSGKTESEKWRQEIDPATADAIISSPALLVGLLPPHFLARYQGVVGQGVLQAVVKICCTRFAVENPIDRWTLDLCVETDTGKCLHGGVLEYKSTDPNATPSSRFNLLQVRPIRISKFLWATDWGK